MIGNRVQDLTVLLLRPAENVKALPGVLGTYLQV